MKLKFRIITFSLLFFYVVSTAHSAIPHCHGENHHHHDNEHDHHHQHNEDGRHIFSITKGFLHTVSHFFDHLNHHHDCFKDHEFIKSSDFSPSLSFYIISHSFWFLEKNEKQYIPNWKYLPLFSKIDFSNISLRGPPSFF